MTVISVKKKAAEMQRRHLIHGHHITGFIWGHKGQARVKDHIHIHSLHNQKNDSTTHCQPRGGTGF